MRLSKACTRAPLKVYWAANLLPSLQFPQANVLALRSLTHCSEANQTSLSDTVSPPSNVHTYNYDNDLANYVAYTGYLDHFYSNY